MRLYVGIFLMLFTAGLVLTGQNEIVQDSISLLARNELNKRFEKFKLQKKRECKTKALLDAETFVDSLIVAQIDLHLVDTINFPEKPIKPQYPEKIEIIDSININPIIDKTPR